MEPTSSRKVYPSDVTDEEGAFLAPYLTLMNPDAPQRDYPLRELFKALRWVVRSGSPWRYLPGDFPPWPAVYQQARRWLHAGCFERLAHDVRALLRQQLGRAPAPTAAVFDSRTLRSTP